MSKLSDEEVMKQCYQNTHFAGELVTKFFAHDGTLAPMPAAEAVDKFHHLKRILTEAVCAAQELENRAVAKI